METEMLLSKQQMQERSLQEPVLYVYDRRGKLVWTSSWDQPWPRVVGGDRVTVCSHGRAVNLTLRRGAATVELACKAAILAAVVFTLMMLLMGCVAEQSLNTHRLGCDGDSSGGSSSGSSSGGSSGGGTTAEPPTDCDATVGGRVLVVGLDTATGDGPTVVYLHGTYETPEGVLATDSAAQAVAAAVDGEGGVLLLPRGRGWWLPGGPWPWGAVTGDAAWMAADAALVEAALACVPGDPDRVSVAGFSAGAIAAAYLGEARPWASIVLWSGGVQPLDRPALPDAPGVMALHGGAGDIAQLREGAIDYAEQAPSLGVLCDHGGGHATAQGTDGAAFIRDARASGHPWAAAWPGGWTLDHYCGVVP